MYIPFGHNLSGETLGIFEDTAPDLGGAPNQIGSLVVPDDQAIDLALTPSSLRYLSLNVITASGTFRIPQWILTNTVTTTTGPEPGWDRSPVTNTDIFPRQSGAEARLERGEIQQSFGLRYRQVGIRDAADVATMRLFVDTVGLARPFLFDAPYDDGGTFWMFFSRDPRVASTARNPFIGNEYETLDFDLIENVA